MKQIVMAVLVVLLVPSGVSAQSMEATIEKALAAAPSRAREAATVIRWHADFTYETLKEGSGSLVCYDRSDEPRRATFDVQCTSLENLPRVAQSRQFRAESADRQGERAAVAAAEADGTRILPQYGSLWIAMRGDDLAGAGTHTTIAMPGATMASSGFPEDRSQGGAYIMAAGTTTAHLMIPGR